MSHLTDMRPITTPYYRTVLINPLSRVCTYYLMLYYNYVVLPYRYLFVTVKLPERIRRESNPDIKTGSGFLPPESITISDVHFKQIGD